jgi:hypothetical protein
MGCQLTAELGRRYLGALNSVRRAQQRVNHAVTVTNLECANTELRRLEEYRQDILREIIEHCEIHDCATQELEDTCRQPLGVRALAVA